MIVASGNDATVAMAEHIGGNEDSFVDLMNQTAQYLDMKDSHFMNATGLPQDEHYTTAADLAKLARHIIYDFPERYDWFAQKWFTYNKIKQPNRNRLLWRNASVDGLKTGHTSSAGFCLVASGFQEDTRLIAVVMGAESDEKRAEETESLLNYGFRYYSTKLIQTKEQSIAKLRIWEGQSEKVAVGIDQDVYITIIKGQAESHQVHLKLDHNVTAPIQLGQQLGTLEVEDDNNHQVLASIPLIAKEAISEGSLWQKWCDRVIRRFS
jgi:D-alanyl-D-alanine carboxypeptidase (penicillin-binding protein 5/6)